VRYLLAVITLAMVFLAAGGPQAATLPIPSELAARIPAPALPVTVYEPHLATEAGPVARGYRAYPFQSVAEALFGENWRDGADAFEFRAIDGYVSIIPFADFLAHRAYLAVGLADGGPFTVDNLLQNESDISLGPYYLIWENIDDPEIFARGASIWPYQISEIAPVTLSDAALLPQGLDPSLRSAAALAKTYCLNCHNLNGFGGDKVEGNLSALARNLDDDTFRAWVLNPRSVRPDTTMPALSESLPDGERVRIAEELRAYLLAMPGGD
jgi:hypothetical protein